MYKISTSAGYLMSFAMLFCRATLPQELRCSGCHTAHHRGVASSDEASELGEITGISPRRYININIDI